MASSSTHSGSQRDWASLPMEMLDLILEKLFLVQDYVRFDSVCKHWHSCALNQKQLRLATCPKQPPMLLIAVPGNEDEGQLYSIWEDKVYNHRVPIAGEPSYSCGASYGWWAIGNGEVRDRPLTLLNPFSGQTINLPKPQTLWFYFDKVILSCNPNLHPNDYWVAAIISRNRIEFLKSGEQSWTCVEFHPGMLIQDIYFFEGKLYYLFGRTSMGAIDYSRRDDNNEVPLKTLVANLDTAGPYDLNTYMELPHSTIDEWVAGGIFGDQKYLLGGRCYFVQSLDGDLLLILRLRASWEENNPTVGFKVHKFLRNTPPSDDNEAEWIDVDSLEDSVIFLGGNLHSFCVSAASVPNCRSNSIYFIEQPMMEWAMDEPNGVNIGVFNLERKQILRYYYFPDSLKSKIPLWFQPTLT